MECRNICVGEQFVDVTLITLFSQKKNPTFQMAYFQLHVMSCFLSGHIINHKKAMERIP